MNRKDIRFPHDTADGYCLRCMDNEYGTNQNAVDTIAAASSTVEDFIDRFLKEGDPNEQFYQVLMETERPEMVWKYIRSVFGDRQFKTNSDAGSLLVGARPDFSVLIPNGRGDGTTRVAVFDSKEDFLPLESLMRYWTRISGRRIWIWDYDCYDPAVALPAKQLDGCFNVYYHDGFIAFVRKS